MTALQFCFVFFWGQTWWCSEITSVSTWKIIWGARNQTQFAHVLSKCPTHFTIFPTSDQFLKMKSVTRISCIYLLCGKTFKAKICTPWIKNYNRRCELSNIYFPLKRENSLSDHLFLSDLVQGRDLSQLKYLDLYGLPGFYSQHGIWHREPH